MPEPSDRFIQINQPSVCRDLGVLTKSCGIFLVIREYESLYERLVLAHRSPKVDRVVLTGQPGIGKSTFAIYALLRRMTQGQPVFFSTTTGDTYLFDEFGVSFKRKHSVVRKDLPPYDSAIPHSKAWSLIDANVEGGPERSGVMNDAPLFPVLATSPNRRRYKDWISRYSLTFIMEPWTVEELHAVLMIIKDMIPSLEVPDTLADVKKLMVETGPCLTDLITYSADKIGWDVQLQAGLGTLTSPQMIVDIFREADITIDSASHSLVLVRRSKSGPPLQSDRPIIQLKSPIISWKVQKRFQYLHAEVATRLFEASSTFAAGSVLAGWIFETLVIGYLSRQQIGADGIFRQLALMTRIYDFHFQHFLEEGTSPTGFIEVSGISGITVFAKDSLKLHSVPQQVEYSPLPLVRKKVVRYHHLDRSFHLDFSSLYVPLKHNNALFDSFFVEISPDKTRAILWVFQMTIAKEHGGSPKGVEPLLTIIKSLVRSGWEVFTKYVLVAPHRPGEGVKWKLPDEWKRVAGSVYVLYVDFSALPEFNYDDIFTQY